MAVQRQGGRLGEGAAGADPQHAVLRLDDVAGARQEERPAAVGDEHEGLEVAERAVGAPLLGQLHGPPLQVAAALAQFLLEAGEQGECVGGGAGEPGQDLAVEQAADLAGGVLDDGILEGHLAVAGQDRAAVFLHEQNGGSVDGRHGIHGVSGRAGAAGRGRGAGLRPSSAPAPSA